MSQYSNNGRDRLDLPGENKAASAEPTIREQGTHQRPRTYQVDAQFEEYYDPRYAGGQVPQYQPQQQAPQYQMPPQYQQPKYQAPQGYYQQPNPYPAPQYQQPQYQQPQYQDPQYQEPRYEEDPYQTEYDYEGTPASDEPYIREERQKAKKKRNAFGKVLLVMELIVSVVVIGLLLFLNILPSRFLLIGSGGLLLYWLIMLGLQQPRATRGFGKAMMILMILVLALSTGYLWRTNAALSNLFEAGNGESGEARSGIGNALEGIFGGKSAQKPFTVYISGNDGYGETSEEGRTDVNILVTVNPETHQILMTTTPRDYYIELPEEDFGGARDKLTHAGIYGIDVSEEVLSNLYGVDIDYYVRVNFSGFEGIVDALGGVSVWSDYDFTATTGDTFYQGYNEVNGVQALAFVRERYAFTDGDFQRGRNQMYMIKAIIAKMTSPSILVNYSSLLASVESCVLTDMPQSKITSLIRLQLDESPDWNIVSNTVGGWGDMQPTYSGGSEYLSVVWPNDEDVAKASELIQRCLNGEILEGN